MIRVANLTKDFGGNQVLDGVSFELAKGEAAFVLGPSGAGKPTLLRCVNGLVWPTAGTV
jgi:ABC-type Fe3+/spermidine/putrescine transport system ATPase subunit